MELAARLRADASRADERRILVLAGTPAATREQAREAIDAANIDREATRYVGTADPLDCPGIDPKHVGRLLGTTREAVVLDCQEACRPNALGAATGAADGGGLLILLTPPLDEWRDRRDDFDATLSVPPFDREEVTGYFRQRLVNTLREHRGIAVVDADSGAIEREGIIDGPPRLPRSDPTQPADTVFPPAAYDACLTQDQAETVATLEALRTEGQAIVVEADRGRGKSSAAGIAAASLAIEGNDVLVTAPAYRNAGEVFARAAEVLADLGELADRDRAEEPRVIETETGRVRFELPPKATDLPDDPDRVIVDEAAALPVRVLERFLDAGSVAYATTIHGYEGAGRGFSVRFREHLAESDFDVTTVSLDEPIRYAPADPIEVWAFRALCLDARPAVEPLVVNAGPETVTYRGVEAADLLADEQLLREAFGLLVLAHYRTEPDDLARLLDAPNVSVRVLLHDGHVVSVALLAREGGLPADLRERMYEGARVPGNMLPDVLTTQLRDERAGEAVGYRVLRIATHHAARSRGLGSTLLDRIREEVSQRADWLGVGYGATPELLRFWRDNGFHTVHLSTTRNDASGEHSAIMLDPLSKAGQDLLDRHTGWFLDRMPGILSDPLSDLDPDVVRTALRSVAFAREPVLSEPEWRHAAGLPSGIAIFDTAPGVVRKLTVPALVSGETALTPGQERLLVAKALQARPWGEVADMLGFGSHSACMRAFGDAAGPLVDAYGDEQVQAERGRFE
jgi:tRNA(Met) cytidine acetyltransferase